MSRIPLRAFAASFALMGSPAMASSVSTAWAQLPSNNQEECLSIGSRAVESVGFRASISQDRQTVFGWRGEEALTVRCISASGVAVVFAWVTDEANDSGRLVEAVTSAYRNRGVTGGGNLGGGNLGGGNLGGGNFGGGGGNLSPGAFGSAPGGGIVKR
ncbi:hypothetical protein [Neoroseomonas eburnea]|uniref:hypothetical protein n=1 Tax=Neoroseomonas eburnea TaxID=1346889 RepID=UPI001BAC79BC|nr:hypothetical protein [Neoroseomonas eburnea]